jgi:nitroreductase / dihydropteridine reductase
MSFLDSLHWRYATKKFNETKVPANALAHVLESVRFAPSSFGIQPYHVVVVEDAALKEQINKHTFWDQQQIATCSHLLVFCVDIDLAERAREYVTLATAAGRTDVTSDPDFDYAVEAAAFGNKMGPEWAAKQAYLALGFALAACAELRIDSCPMEAAHLEKIKGLLDLPTRYEPKVLLPIGYRSPEDAHASDAKVRFDESGLFSTAA